MRRLAMHRLPQCVVLCVTIALLWGCAQVRSISGGMKDTMPPHIIGMSPDSLSTHFSENSFTITFDEYVQLRNVQQELLVSPPLKKAPRVQLRQRDLTVSWDDTLAQNTTYTFQFGNAISDLNEGNPLPDVAYIFSTGDVLDSLQCNGIVRDAQLDAPAKGMKVLLFDSLSQVFDKKQPPVYFGRTDEQGRFSMKYLRPGKFLLCALSDENANYHYDAGEALAWIDGVETATAADTAEHILRVSIPRDTSWTIREYKTDSIGALRFYVEPWMQGIRVRALGDQMLQQWQVGDTLYASATLSQAEEIRYEVGLNGMKRDTVEARVLRTQPSSFRLQASAKDKIWSSGSIELRADRLLAAIDTERIQMFEDSVAIHFDMDRTTPDRVKLSSIWRHGYSYACRVIPGFMTDAYGSTNDSLSFNFSVYESKELGALRMKLPACVDQSNAVLVLKDKNNIIVHSSSDVRAGVLTIQSLLPGDYSAIITEDTNANGRFDPMVIAPVQPTEVNHVYPGKISVRANWDVEIAWPDWSLSGK